MESGFEVFDARKKWKAGPIVLGTEVAVVDSRSGLAA